MPIDPICYKDQKALRDKLRLEKANEMMKNLKIYFLLLYSMRVAIEQKLHYL